MFHVFNFLILEYEGGQKKKIETLNLVMEIVPFALLSDVVVTLDVGCKMKFIKMYKEKKDEKSRKKSASALQS